jgi:hypothetical protein
MKQFFCVDFPLLPYMMNDYGSSFVSYVYMVVFVGTVSGANQYFLWMYFLFLTVAPYEI